MQAPELTATADAAFAAAPADGVSTDGPHRASYTSSNSVFQHLDRDGIIQRSAGQVEHVYGMGSDELAGRDVTHLLHPGDRSAAIEMWIDLLDSPGGSRAIQHRVLRPDGTDIWIHSLVINRLDTEGSVLAISHDITVERAQRFALEASEQELRFLTEAVPVAVFRADAGGAVRFANARWAVLIGDAASLDDVLALLDPDDARSLADTCVRAKVGRSAELVRVRHADGRHLEFRLQGVDAPAESDDGVGVIGTVDDVTSEVLRTHRLEATAERDHLTGLTNRRGLIRRLERSMDDGRPNLVLFGDLDGFKAVNDEWGHGTGDRMLTAIGQRLRSAVRPGDVVGRWGGDEFVVLCEAVPPGGEETVIDRLHGCLREPLEVDGNRYDARVSLGAVRPHPGEHAEDVLRRADSAMYESKRAARRRP